MKRRTFLRLSSAALAALGLSACGAKTASSSTEPGSFPEMDTDIPADSSEPLDIGLTLEEAKNSSNHFYIHRSNGKFYPLLVPTYYGTSSSPDYPYYLDISTALIIDNISYQESFPYGERAGNPLTDNTSLLDGDELVYISNGSIPNYIYFMPITQTFPTLPVLFEGGNPYREFCTADEILGIRALPSRKFFDYDSSYIPAGQYSDDYLSVGLPNLTINGLSVQDYVLSHSMIPIYHTRYERTSDHVIDTYNYRYIVDLTDSTDIDEAKWQNGIIELTNENDQNTVTVSYYEGTQYHSLTLRSTSIAILFDSDRSCCVPLSLTQNGYAVIDTSTLSPDGYAIGLSSDYEKHSLDTAYHFISISQ